MGRTKSASQNPSHSIVSKQTTPQETKLKEMLVELYTLMEKYETLRKESLLNITQVAKQKDKVQAETKLTSHSRTKLRALYETVRSDAETESDMLRQTLDKLAQIKEFRSDKGGERRMRRGVLMSVLQNSALTLPLWISKSSGDEPPPLCGAISAENSYLCKSGDKVAARVRSADGEENWILADVVHYDRKEAKYEVDDIDAEDGKERHTLSRRRVVPLPVYKANPETDPQALFKQGALVLALYPQTTCFYRAVIHETPAKSSEDYSVLFEDNSYPDGYSPPLKVAQRFVIACKDDKRSK